MKILIIIPYYYESAALGKLLEKFDFLGVNKTPEVEIVCVNNGGEDFSKNNLSFDSIFFINENKNLNSPYSCRNRGIEFRKVDWYIFIDATCIPHDDWFDVILDNIAKNNNSSNCIFAANVGFKPKVGPTIGNIYDSIVNIDNQRSIAEDGCAKTACLAVNSESIFKVGGFEEGIRSGGDVLWTKKANRMGYNICFLSGWKVDKLSRNTCQLIKKQFRVSIGWPKIWAEEKNYAIKLFKTVFLCFLPPVPFSLYKTAKRRGVVLSGMSKVNLVMFGLVLRLVSGLGVVYGIFRPVKK